MPVRSPSLPSVMQHAFSNVPAPSINRSVFNRSHGIKTAFNAGELIPFFVDEVLPGDTINLNANMVGRVQTLLYPLMDNLFLDTFYFFVPSRLLWDNWERFNGAQDNPDDPTDYEVPVVGPFDDDRLELEQLSIGDYFGLPTKVEIRPADYPNALPFRAYNFIYNTWFRDENLQDSVYFPTDDGPDYMFSPSDSTGYRILRRGKRHDYFTSSLPFAQKGDDVTVPFATTAPVIGTGLTLGLTDGTTNGGLQTRMVDGTDDWPLFVQAGAYNIAPGARTPGGGEASSGFAFGVTSNPLTSGLAADLTGASAITINDLRDAIAMQHVLETDARGGTRYTEMLKAHWGVTVPDFRLQRPEYLGGSSKRVAVTAVAQTTAAASPTARDGKGTQAGYGVVTERSGFSKSIVEYGYIIGLVNVRADISYQQGIRRMWSRRTRFDFPLPALMHLGEQPVLKKEIYYADMYPNADEVWGYQERYAEYRYFPSNVTGPFRSNYTGTLDAWHLALDFDAEPALDATFIEDHPPMARVVQVNTEPDMLLDGYIEIKHARPMPVYAVPGLGRL